MYLQDCTVPRLADALLEIGIPMVCCMRMISSSSSFHHHGCLKAPPKKPNLEPLPRINGVNPADLYSETLIWILEYWIGRGGPDMHGSIQPRPGISQPSHSWPQQTKENCPKMLASWILVTSTAKTIAVGKREERQGMDSFAQCFDPRNKHSIEIAGGIMRGWEHGMMV
jgi:hypothetical protein